jgi:hypothetical protein
MNFVLWLIASPFLLLALAGFCLWVLYIVGNVMDAFKAAKYKISLENAVYEQIGTDWVSCKEVERQLLTTYPDIVPNVNNVMIGNLEQQFNTLEKEGLIEFEFVQNWRGTQAISTKYVRKKLGALPDHEILEKIYQKSPD